jgi:hypothetical protein
MTDRETPQTALEAYLQARVEALEEALRIAGGTTDTAIVMKVPLNTLQEEGFIIKNGDGSRVFELSALSR